MWIYIIVLCVILGIVYTIYESLTDRFGVPAVVINLVVGIIAFIVFSWMGLLVLAVADVAVWLVIQAGRRVSKTVETHDKQQKEIAKTNQRAQEIETVRTNDQALQQELQKQCRFLGCMNSSEWRAKLPNYVNKEYSTSFDTITNNYARQIEEQKIIQNKEMFVPYIKYIVKYPQGKSIAQLLDQVDSDLFQYTHITPDEKLLETLLDERLVKKSVDVPALFTKTPINGGIYLYHPTEYAKRQYGEATSNTGESRQEEISFDDL